MRTALTEEERERDGGGGKVIVDTLEVYSRVGTRAAEGRGRGNNWGLP